MMTFVVMPMLTMLVGFLAGVCVMDSVGENKRIRDLERKIKRLERKVEEC